jgi:hypothetical protein
VHPSSAPGGTPSVWAGTLTGRSVQGCGIRQRSPARLREGVRDQAGQRPDVGIDVDVTSPTHNSLPAVRHPFPASTAFTF